VAATGKLFGKLFTALWNKEIDYDTDTIKVMLTTSSYTPDQDAHDYKDDVTNEVAATGGYTAGGNALGSKTVTYTGATNKHVLDCADPQWTTSTITARNAIFYNASPGADSTRPLIGYQAETGDVSTTGGNFDIIIAAAGLVEITVG
jgi:hypothetical protein